MNKTAIFFIALISCVMSFTLGYKVGDSKGYSDGYNVGYLYDCKEEIGDLYKRVNNTSKALQYTDSFLKTVHRENDSLKRKEYYQNLAQHRKDVWEQYSSDSSRYSVVAEILSDSLCDVVGYFHTNVIQSNGRRNIFVCTMIDKFKNLPECQDGFDIRSKLDKMLKAEKKKGRK